MTDEQVKAHLEQIKHFKKSIPALQSEIKETIKLSNALNALIATVDNVSPACTELRKKLERKQERLSHDLDVANGIYGIEEVLSRAINSLVEIQRDIVIGYYFQCKAEAKLSMVYNYSLRNIKYIKAKAIGNITLYIIQHEGYRVVQV